MFTRLLTFISLFSFSVVSFSDTQNNSVMVQTVALEYQPLAQPVLTSGRLAPKSEQRLAFKTSGPVANILVDEGQKVKAGQVLAQLDTEEIEAQVAEARSLRKDAQRTLTRYQSLYEKNVIPQDQLQGAETALAVAEAKLRVAEFNLKHSKIIAPGDGKILQRMVEPNEMVSPLQPVFMISLDKGGWILRGSVTDRDMVRLGLGDDAQIQLDALPGQTIPGEVSVLSAASQHHQLFELEITLKDTPATMHAGFIGHATITPSQTEPLALLPSSTLVGARNGKATVFTLDNRGQTVAEEVEIAWIQGDEIAVRTNLPAGSLVVSEGATYLNPGMTPQLATNSVR